MFRFLSVSKALAAAAAAAVSASVLGFALAPVSSAQAGVITVVIDNFDAATLASPGLSSLTVLSNPYGATSSAGTSAGTFVVDLGAGVTASVGLSYGNVPLPANVGWATLSYKVPYSNLGNLPVGSSASDENLITVSGTTTAFPRLPSVTSPTGVTVSVPFVAGGLNFVFSTASSSAWDMIIDQVQLQIQCDAVADVTYGVAGTSTAPVSGLVAYLAAAPKNCAGKVPVPASAALILAGLAGLAIRRARKA